ncbi:hypothetical protein RND71_023986 [Anisodus tanguticus]|uniref:Uncharacterized protein n=1 Tax=Anisodus tanguticus TaxID=243964 RepID=A0AAE1VC40_9SOLA|nr:hypothetical protein RND71_023986 [Anisodus tanguticus]
MGSSSALISNLHLIQTHCFKCLNSETSLNINQTRPKLNLSSRKKYIKKFSRLVCSAVEDSIEKQRETNGANASSIGSVVEDRPGKKIPT